MSNNGSELILAFDFGGTKCQAMLLDSSGNICGMGIGQGPEISGRSREAAQMAFKEAVGDRPAIEAMRMVYNHPQVLSHLKHLPVLCREFFFVDEETAVLEMSGEACGVVVLSGTGSFVYGKDRSGRGLRLDGLGPVLGDFGGGYSIGLQALRAAAKSDWHARYRTSLRPRVFQYCNVSGIGELIEFSLQPHDRSVIAGLARIVHEEAQNGDAIAGSILRSAADDIADTLRAVLEILNMCSERYKMIGTGSVVRSDIYWNHLCSKTRAFAPLLDPVRPNMPQVFGVACAGLRHFYPGGAASVREKLAQQYLERSGNN